MFHNVSVKPINKTLTNLNVSKATGTEQIPAAIDLRLPKIMYLSINPVIQTLRL